MSRIARLREKRRNNKKSIYKKMLVGLFVPVFFVFSFFIYTVFAEVDALGPEELTDGSFTNNNKPELEFLLSHDDEEEELPLRYRIEICSTYTGGATCFNSRVVSYDSAQNINPEEGPELHTFTVGQPAGDGEYALIEEGPDTIGFEGQSLDDGPYWWRVQTFDDSEPEVGSGFVWASGENEPSFIVDTQAPEITLDEITPNPTNSTTVELTGTATDALDVVGLVEFQVNSTAGSWEECDADDEYGLQEVAFTCTVDIEGLEDGEHTIYVRATDRLDDTGNTTDSDFLFETVTVDTSGPTGGSITYANGYYTVLSVAITVNDGNDPAGIDTDSRTLERRSSALSGGECDEFGSFEEIEYSGTYPNLTDNSVETNTCYQYQYLVSDNLGNETTYTSGNTAMIDVTAPTVPGEPSTSTPTSNTVPTWTWAESTDAGSGVVQYLVQWCQNDEFDGCGDNTDTTDDVGGGIVSYTQTSSLADGTWYFVARAEDEAGNVSGPSPVGEVVIDTEELAIIEDSIEADPSDTSAVITWETNKIATSVVEYGFDSQILDDSGDAPGYTEDHEVILTDLFPCTTYFYLVFSEDEVGNDVEEGGLSFTTTDCTGDASVIAETIDVVDNDGGGIVELLNEDLTGIELDIPNDFLPDEVEEEEAIFQIKNLNTGEVIGSTGSPEGYGVIAGYTYDLQAYVGTDELTEFKNPIIITIFFDESEVEGIELDSLNIFRWETDSWEMLDCEVNAENYSITCETINFSTFGLFGEGIPPVPPTPKPSEGSSFSSSTPPSCTEALPNGAPNLFQIDVSDTQAKLYFSPLGAPNDKYAVVYGYESGDERFGIMFDYGPASGVLSYTINDLEPNAIYFFKVRGQNGCMPGVWSNEMKITTKPAGSMGGTSFYRDFISRVLSIFPKDITEVQ